MKKMIPIQILLLSSALLLTSCHSNRQLVGMGSVKDLTDSIWTYGISHPDGFTLDINTMTEPVFVLSEGREVRLDTQHRSPEWTLQEAECAESLNIRPTEDTVIVKLNWWLAKAELRDFSLAHLDSVMNTLCHAGAHFEITYWDYQYEYWSFIPAKMRAEYLYDQMNEMCPNSVVAVHIRYELLKEWEEIPNQTPYKVLMICRKH